MTAVVDVTPCPYCAGPVFEGVGWDEDTGRMTNARMCQSCGRSLSDTLTAGEWLAWLRRRQQILAARRAA